MKKRIAIIGGGITGLTSAYILSKKNYDVHLYERSNELGGLAAGFEVNGTHLEKAYHHIFTTDSSIISLVQELGLDDSLLWKKGSIGVYFENILYPLGTPADLLRFSPLSLKNRIRTGLVLFYLQKIPYWKQFIRITASAWLEKYMGERSYSVIWEPLLKGKFHHFHDSISMAWFWARIHTRANSRSQDGSSEKLGYFKGGFHTLISELVSRIQTQGVKIQTGALLHRIRSLPDNTFIVEGENILEKYDQIIATTPSPIFAQFIKEEIGVPSDYVAKLQNTQYLNALCAVFTTPQKLTPYYWNNINDSTSPFLAFICHTNLIDSQYYNNEEVYYLGTYLPQGHPTFQMSEAEIYSLFFTYLKKLIPPFDESKVTQKFVFKLKNGQHIVDSAYADNIPSYETPLAGVYLVNFSQIFPEDRGTNFAVRQAFEVCELLQRD